MGRDKALPPAGPDRLYPRSPRLSPGRPVRHACGDVRRYRQSFPNCCSRSHPDSRRWAGYTPPWPPPTADWNLIVACDMPDLSVSLLGEMLNRAEELGVDCLAARSPSGLPEPLCAGIIAAVWRG